MRKASLHALWIVLAVLLPMSVVAADTPPMRIAPMDGAVATIYGPFSYDPSGNIMAIGSTPGSYYVYDPMSRVVTAGVQQGTTVNNQSYAYDVYGNRLGVGGAGGGTYTVDAETNRLTSHGAQYDSAGNLTRWYPPGFPYAREYSYDAAGMLTQELAPVGSYPEWSTLHLYTASDERYWTYATGATYADVVSHYTIRDLGGKVLRDYMQDANGFSVANDYVYRDGLLLASIKASATHHYSLDHLGTPRIVTDQEGAKLAEHAYYPFGLEITDGSPADGLLKFTGHERNPDVLSQANGQLDYMHARFYGANLGRFLTADPYLDVEKTMSNPQMWNRYAYVTNNPMRYTDPTGKTLWDKLFRIVAYVGKRGEVIDTIHEISKNKALPKIRQALDKINDGRKRTVIIENGTNADTKTLSKALDTKGKATDVEKSFGYPEGRHPATADGPYRDVHVQTSDATKAAGFGKGFLAILVPTTIAASANADATPGEIVSAALWDVAKTIDPVFLTDGIEYVTGVGAYAEETAPPE